MAPSRTTPRIVMITTGGTVASRSGADGAVPVLGAAELLAPVASAQSHLDPQPEIVAVDLMSVDSSAMGPADQFRIVAAIAEALSDNSTEGVVVTHGTDTMEETAFLADLYAADRRPVIFTGAQFPSDSAHSDGPSNIAAAVAAALDPTNHSRGVLLAMGGRLTAARGAFKSSTSDPDAFDTVTATMRRPLLTGPVPRGRPARVDSYTLYPGISPAIIAAAVSQNAAGIVLAGTGSGNTHPDITAEVTLARQRGVVVVMTTRVPFGPVVATYGGGGGAVDIERAGAIVSRWLRAPQARMALMALLSAGCDHDEVSDFFSASEPADSGV